MDRSRPERGTQSMSLVFRDIKLKIPKTYTNHSLVLYASHEGYGGRRYFHDLTSAMKSAPGSNQKANINVKHSLPDECDQDTKDESKNYPKGDSSISNYRIETKVTSNTFFDGETKVIIRTNGYISYTGGNDREYVKWETVSNGGNNWLNGVLSGKILHEGDSQSLYRRRTFKPYIYRGGRRAFLR